VIVAFPALSRGGGHHGQGREYRAAETPAAPSFALVVGNGSYSTITPLRNPVNDARAMDQALRSTGFDVIRLENATRAQFDAGLQQLIARLNAGTVSVFYYAGHAVQMGGRNYLIPVDARVDSDAALRVAAIDLDDVLRRITAAGGHVNIVVLDACRNNPFQNMAPAASNEPLRQAVGMSDSRFRGIGSGLAPVTAPSGLLIAYSTAPGSVAADGDGPNGLYTGELIRTMVRGHQGIEGMFKETRNAVIAKSGGAQIPWESSSLTNNYAFRPREAPSYAATPTNSPSTYPSTQESSPTVAAVRGATPLPPGDRLVARIASLAAQQGISMADSFDIRAPDPGAPTGSAALLGAWGPGMWSGGGSRNIYVVEEIDRNNSVRLVEMFSDCCLGMLRYKANFRKRTAILVNGRIIIQHRRGWDQQIMTTELELLSDGQLHGTAVTPDGNVAKVTLPRIQ
jgi:uncharacterized caspase-like protein